jgi:hypothetical protein
VSDDGETPCGADDEETVDARGMSRLQADSLVSVALDAISGAHVLSQPDGARWRVHVETRSAGVFMLYDEADWRWLQPQIVRAMEQ